MKTLHSFSPPDPGLIRLTFDRVCEANAEGTPLDDLVEFTAAELGIDSITVVEAVFELER